MGNAHRSPIFPYFDIPYFGDIEKYVNRYRFENTLEIELLTMYRI